MIIYRHTVVTVARVTRLRDRVYARLGQLGITVVQLARRLGTSRQNLHKRLARGKLTEGYWLKLTAALEWEGPKDWTGHFDPEVKARRLAKRIVAKLALRAEKTAHEKVAKQRRRR